jgi:hypothetical protein
VAEEEGACKAGTSDGEKSEMTDVLGVMQMRDNLKQEFGWEASEIRHRMWRAGGTMVWVGSMQVGKGQP